jgi:hypothetical protein
VQSDKQLKHFLDSFRQFFDFFFDELGGQASSPVRLQKMLESHV